MSRSPIITDADWLPNDHAGALLASEFLQPIGLDEAGLASAVGVSPDRLRNVVRGQARLDADLDLRLTRYFGLSEGFFLRLQNSYELLEAKRALSGELDRIVPRAA